jgi:hypothetical protein
LFPEQTVDCLTEALTTFEARAADFTPAAARRHAVRFNKQRFAEELFAYLDTVLHVNTAAVRRAA